MYKELLDSSTAPLAALSGTLFVLFGLTALNELMWIGSGQTPVAYSSVVAELVVVTMIGLGLVVIAFWKASGAGSIRRAYPTAGVLLSITGLLASMLLLIASTIDASSVSQAGAGISLLLVQISGVLAVFAGFPLGMVSSLLGAMPRRDQGDDPTATQE